MGGVHDPAGHAELGGAGSGAQDFSIITHPKSIRFTSKGEEVTLLPACSTRVVLQPQRTDSFCLDEYAALRAALKVLGRGFGLRAISITTDPENRGQADRRVVRD